MKRELKNRTNTLEAVYRFCLENSIVWTGIVAIANVVTALGLKITSIVNTEAKQQRNNKGVTLTKAQLKTIMLGMGSTVAGAMQAYAKTINDMTMFKNFAFAEGKLRAGSGSNAISACRNVLSLATAIPVADRSPFGVSDAVLTSLEDSIKDFTDNGNSATRNVITEKTALTKMLDTLVGEGSQIMRDELIKLARQLKDSHPEFYIQLVQNAKVINHTTHTKISVEAFDDVSEKVLSGMTVIVDGTGFSGVTNSKGKCTIYVPAGNYSITSSKQNYITMKQDVKVQKGANSFKVELAPAFNIPAEVVEKVVIEK